MSRVRIGRFDLHPAAAHPDLLAVPVAAALSAAARQDASCADVAVAEIDPDFVLATTRADGGVIPGLAVGSTAQ